MSDKATLTEIVTDEVSIVDAAANRRVFAILKRANPMAGHLLEQIAKSKLDCEPKLVARMKAEGTDNPDTQAAFIAAVKLLQSISDVVTSEQMTELLSMAGLPTPDPANDPDKAKADGEGESGEDDTDKSDDEESDEEDKEKSVTKAAKMKTKEADARIAAIEKSTRDAIAKRDREISDLRKAHEEEREKRLHAEAVDLAKNEYNLLGKPEEVADTIRKAQQSGGWDALQPILKSAQERIEKSNLLGELGHGANVHADDDEAQISAIADGIMKSSDKKISRQKAVAEAWSTPKGREIYKRKHGSR